MCDDDATCRLFKDGKCKLEPPEHEHGMCVDDPHRRLAGRQAIRLRPDYSIAWNNLAGACKDEGDLRNAVAGIVSAGCAHAAWRRRT